MADIPPDRNLALELVRVTEAAALQAARRIGMGDKEAADQAAVDGMHAVLHTIHMDGVVVIGEGEKDEAPMLANGEIVGDGTGPRVDIAVDPLEGTRLAAEGRPNALSVIGAISPRSVHATDQEKLIKVTTSAAIGRPRICKISMALMNLYVLVSYRWNSTNLAEVLDPAVGVVPRNGAGSFLK